MPINMHWLDEQLGLEAVTHLAQMVERIQAGEVVLFVGAAIHCPPPPELDYVYPEADRPPSAWELRSTLIDKLWPPHREGLVKDQNQRVINEHWPLSLVAQYYDDQLGRKDLIQQLHRMLAEKAPSRMVKALCRMPFKYIVTTNYDCLLEKAMEEAGKTGYHKSAYSANKVGVPQNTVNVPDTDISESSPFLFKLHGDIEHAMPQLGNYRKTDDSIVLTDEDYIHFVLRMSQNAAVKQKPDSALFEKPSAPFSETNLYPIPKIIEDTFAGLNGRTFLFIGYSLKDFNLRLLFKSVMWQKDPSNYYTDIPKWSIDFKPDSTIKNAFEKNFNFIFIEKNAWYAITYLYKLLFPAEDDLPL